MASSSTTTTTSTASRNRLPRTNHNNKQQPVKWADRQAESKKQKRRKVLGIDQMETDIQRVAAEIVFWKGLRMRIGEYGQEAMFAVIQNPDGIDKYVQQAIRRKELLEEMLQKAKEVL